MSRATTIVFAREDLSIPGTPASSEHLADHADAVQARFFDLVMANNPDIIVLDFSAVPPSGSDTILSIRRRCAAPILVICEPGTQWRKNTGSPVRLSVFLGRQISSRSTDR